MKHAWLVAVALLATVRLSAQQQTGFLDRSLIVDGTSYRYQVYVPDNYVPDHAWPVILFLHSVSQRGGDGLQPTDYGLGQAVRAHRDRWPFIVVFPQCTSALKWVYPAMQKMALAELAATEKEFVTDTKRVYLTGISMGGFGVWEFAAQFPGRFAAFVPIAGGIHPPPQVPDARVTLAADPSVADPYAETARRIGKTPVWVFHGVDDPLVKVTEARQMFHALQASHADVRYSELAGGHECWTAAYDTPELPEWLLQHILTAEESGE